MTKNLRSHYDNFKKITSHGEKNSEMKTMHKRCWNRLFSLLQKGSHKLTEYPLPIRRVRQQKFQDFTCRRFIY